MLTPRPLILLALAALSANLLHADTPAAPNRALGLTVSALGSGSVVKLTATEPITDHTAYEADGRSVAIAIPDLDIGALAAHYDGIATVTGIEVEKTAFGLQTAETATRSQLKLTLRRDGPVDFRVIRRGRELAIVMGPKGSLPSLDDKDTSNNYKNVIEVDLKSKQVISETYTELPIPAAVAQTEIPVTALPASSAENSSPLQPEPAKAEPVQAASIPVVVAGKPATRLNSMRWAADGLHLIANGSLQPKIIAIENPPRLAIDLAGVLEQSRVRQIPVVRGSVNNVRVGQFSKNPGAVARVVLDLSQAVTYSVTPTANGAIIHIDAPAVMNPVMNPAIAVNTLAAEPVSVSHLPAVENAMQAADVSAPVLNILPEPAPAQPLAALVKAPVVVQDIDAQLADGLFSASKPYSQMSDDDKKSLREAADSGVTVSNSGRGNFASKTLDDDNIRFTGKPISFTFKDADVLDVIRYFHEISRINMVVHPSVKGTITVNLENVPWDQAMDIILRTLGLDYIYSQKVIWIAPASEIINQQKQYLANKKLREQTESPVTKVRRISYPKAAELMKILEKNKSDRGTLMVDTRTNSLIISEIPSFMAKMEKLIGVLDVPSPQVRIEARVVEANSRFSETFGISLTGSWARRGGGLPDRFPNTTGQFGSINPSVGDRTGFLGFLLGNASSSFLLDVDIAAAESRGRGKLLSSPSISVEDNSTAEIRAGQEFTFTTCGATSCTITIKEAVISLNITPQITADGNVALEIDIKNDRLDLGGFESATGTASLPIFRRSAKTRLKVRDGDTAAIAGVASVDEGISQTGVPILSHIPVLGWLFKNRAKTRQNAEILIFITPKILR